MEDLESPSDSPSLQPDQEEPSGNNDPGDILNPEYEEEDRPNAPIGNPTADVDAFEDEEAPETVEAMNEAADSDGAGPGLDDEEDSELEELDETQFQDFDPSALNIPEKPVAVDESNVGLLGVHKRKRTEEEERERKKKKKLGKREKPKRSKKDVDDDFEGGVEIEGKRARKSGGGGAPKEKRRARTPPEIEEENLSPEERRRRALDKRMDEALKTNRPTRRRGGGIDLEAAADAEIEAMRQKMAKACELDADARSKGEIATHKLSILPGVVELMNRNTIQAQLVDPDINILEAVRFMLEPADFDAALPNYKIQRELFRILGNLTKGIGKEALIASGIGKVVLFYTKSIQPQPEIKRAAEKLIGEWMRVILKKSKTLRRTNIPTSSYDPVLSSQLARSSNVVPIDKARIAEQKRKMAMEVPVAGNRARVEGGVGTYNIAPVSNLSNAGIAGRKAGASGEDAFRKIAARGTGPAGGGGSKR